MTEQGTKVEGERTLLAASLVTGVTVCVDGFGSGLGGRNVCRRIKVVEPAEDVAETEVERELAHV
jgi:hypothetical protein